MSKHTCKGNRYLTNCKACKLDYEAAIRLSRWVKSMEKEQPKDVTKLRESNDA